MTYTEFVSGPAAQRRYWARSHVGWARMARARPTGATGRSPRSRARACCTG